MARCGGQTQGLGLLGLQRRHHARCLTHVDAAAQQTSTTTRCHHPSLSCGDGIGSGSGISSAASTLLTPIKSRGALCIWICHMHNAQWCAPLLPFMCMSFLQGAGTCLGCCSCSSNSVICTRPQTSRVFRSSHPSRMWPVPLAHRPAAHFWRTAAVQGTPGRQ